MIRRLMFLSVYLSKVLAMKLEFKVKIHKFVVIAIEFYTKKQKTK